MGGRWRAGSRCRVRHPRGTTTAGDDGFTRPVDRTPDEARAGSRLRGRLDLRAASRVRLTATANDAPQSGKTSDREMDFQRELLDVKARGVRR